MGELWEYHRSDRGLIVPRSGTDMGGIASSYEPRAASEMHFYFDISNTRAKVQVAPTSRLSPVIPFIIGCSISYPKLFQVPSQSVSNGLEEVVN